MIALLCFFLTLFASLFKSKSRLEAENAALRHQLTVLQRKTRGRVYLTNGDRVFLVHLYRWFPSVLKAITIIRPETLVRWHRAGFRRYWRWKSRSLGGRPRIAADLRALIRQMSAENPLWGAPRIHGELLKLGFEVAQFSIAKYMVKRCGPPSQGWRTFLRNPRDGVAHEDCEVQIDKPSIAYWRDHSAGASRRRVTPMPRGSRPSTAAFTRSGARNASEIVILTCRMLHLSRAAICSTPVTVPATISSSRRRPRAIDATSVARVSARIGRRS